MGGGTVHDGQAQSGNEKPVEGRRIGGAGVGFGVRAQVRRGLAQLLHKGGLPAAGSALEDDELFDPAVGVELIKT